LSKRTDGQKTDEQTKAILSAKVININVLSNHARKYMRVSKYVS